MCRRNYYYVDEPGLLKNTHTQAESLLEQARRGIGLEVNSDKYMQIFYLIYPIDFQYWVYLCYYIYVY